MNYNLPTGALLQIPQKYVEAFADVLRAEVEPTGAVERFSEHLHAGIPGVRRILPYIESRDESAPLNVRCEDFHLGVIEEALWRYIAVVPESESNNRYFPEVDLLVITGLARMALHLELPK